jgi:hypothetical protein
VEPEVVAQEREPAWEVVSEPAWEASEQVWGLVSERV